MRILRDVVVVRTDPSELVAVSPSPGVVGEVMELELAAGSSSIDLQVRVTDSRPVIVNGGVRHRIRLALHDDASVAGSGSPTESLGQGT